MSKKLSPRAATSHASVSVESVATFASMAALNGICVDDISAGTSLLATRENKLRLWLAGLTGLVYRLSDRLPGVRFAPVACMQQNT